MALVLIGIGLLGMVLAAVSLLASAHWRRGSEAVRSRLLGAAGALPPGRFRRAELDGLPAPVRRYLESVLKDGQSRIRWARLEQRGEFLVRPDAGGWGPFAAVHEIAPHAPGFLWDARIRMAPGVTARVRDAFAAGEGSMLARVFGVKNVVDVHGTPEIAAGALLRYLAEAVWAPTALLPAAGVVWSPLDASSARATLAAGATTVALDFHFGDDGLVASVFAAARGREAGGRSVPTPWLGRWSRWEERGGFLLPVEGEVAWLLVEGEQVYWRGRIERADFELE